MVLVCCWYLTFLSMTVNNTGCHASSVDLCIGVQLHNRQIIKPKVQRYNNNQTKNPSLTWTWTNIAGDSAIFLTHLAALWEFRRNKTRHVMMSYLWALEKSRLRNNHSLVVSVNLCICIGVYCIWCIIPTNRVSLFASTTLTLTSPHIPHSRQPFSCQLLSTKLTNTFQAYIRCQVHNIFDKEPNA